MVLLAEAEEIIRSPSGERRAEMVRAFAAKLAMAEKVGGTVVATAEEMEAYKQKRREQFVRSRTSLQPLLRTAFCWVPLVPPPAVLTTAQSAEQGARVAGEDPL
eukprot:COSAG04_NODE_869_length_9750_cov_4.497047_4_plen_104_part_00